MIFKRGETGGAESPPAPQAKIRGNNMDEELRNETMDIYQRLMNRGRCAIEIKQIAAGIVALAEQDEVFNIKVEARISVRSHMIKFLCPSCEDDSIGSWREGKFHCAKCPTVFNEKPMRQEVCNAAMQ